MSDDRKIKELMDKLVAMTPQAPPFPEEVTMARQSTPRRRISPALAFSAAAIVVAAVMVPVLLLTTDEVPVVSPTSTVPPVTTTIPGETTTTRAVPTTWSGVVYLHQMPENSFKSDPALVPVVVEVSDPTGSLDPQAPFTDALARMGELSPDLANSIPGEVRIVSLMTTETDSGDRIWLADMNRAFLDGAGGLLADFTMLNQLIYTITETPGVEPQVLFTVEGEPVPAFGSEGIELTSPVGRDDFIGELGLIFLTEPILEREGTYLIEGMANVFEAVLQLAVVDTDGKIIHEEMVQASSGSGEWGEFSVEIPAELVDPGSSSIQLFAYSAEDGSVVDRITVPVPEGEIWGVTLEG